MTKVNLDPNGTSSNSGAVTGSSAHAALSDGSDSTFVDYDAFEGSILTLSDLSLPSGALLLAAQVMVRCRKDGTGPGGVQSTLVADTTKASTGSVTWESAGTLDGVTIFDGTLTDAGLDGASIGIACTSLSVIRAYKAWVQVTYFTKPTVTVTAPTGTVSSNIVRVYWTPAFDVDADSSAYSYEVKVFSSAQYSAGGFDPSTSTATLSGSGSNGAGSLAFSSVLADGDYRAYVRVAAKNTPSHWSDWDYEAFTVDVDKPGNPTVDVTADNGNGRVAIALDDTAGDVTTTHFQVQRYVGDEGYGDVVSGLDCSLLLPLGATDGLIDISGNGRDGTAVGGVAIGGVSSGPLMAEDEGATDFDGTNDRITTAYSTRRNLCTNPTFETGTTGWTKTDADASMTASASTDRAYAGSQSLKLVNADAGDNDYMSMSFSGLTSGDTYTFSAYVYCGAFTSGATSNRCLFASDGVANVATATLTGVTSGWERKSVTVTLGASTNLTVYLYGPQGTVYYDSVLVEKASSAGTYFPTVAQLNSGEAGWLGTAHASASDIGCFANGTARTFMGWAWRDTSDTADALFGGTATSVAPSVLLGSGDQNVYFYSDNSGAPVGWVSAWPGNGQWVHWALVFNEATNVAELFINGVSKGTRSQTVAFNASPGNFQIGAAASGLYPFDGKLGWVSVHGRGLTAAEIQAAFASAEGSSWADVRTTLGGGLVATSGSLVTVYDYEAPNGETVAYRARAYASSVPSYSGWVWATGGWSSGAEWLKCMLDPDLNLSLVVKSYQGFEVPSNTAVHRPLGSSTAIVTGDTPGPEQGSIVLFSKSDTDREDLAALLASGSPILLQVPGHPDRCVRFGDRSSQRVVDAAWEDWHEETLGWTVVDRP